MVLKRHADARGRVAHGGWVRFVRKTAPDAHVARPRQDRTRSGAALSSCSARPVAGTLRARRHTIWADSGQLRIETAAAALIGMRFDSYMSTIYDCA